MAKKRLLIIDSASLIHRAYHALPPLKTSRGEKVWVVYGFILVLMKALQDFKPSYIIAAFDLPGLTFRHKNFPAYKAKREKAPPDLYEQIPKVREALESFNIPIFEKEGFEADDVIGTIAKTASLSDSKKLETIIISGDRDNLQLINDNVKVYILRKGLKDALLYDKNLVKEKYGLWPKQLVDFKSLRGDPSDNIPGVKGIGEKTALDLIQQFGSLNNLYQEIENKTPQSRLLKENLKEKLQKGKDQAFLSKALLEIRKDLQLDFSLRDCQWKYEPEKVASFFKKMEFNSLLKRIQ
jgi:DNA polymerase-1